MSGAFLTIGRGKSGQGETIELDEGALSLSLARALRLHGGAGAWMSPAQFREGKRRIDHWLSQRIIALDVDYHLGGQHAHRGQACDRIDLTSAPCALAHWTPRGLRLLYCLDGAIVDKDVYARVWSALALRAEAWLASLGELPAGELLLDRKARDLARFLWTPSASVDGVDRNDPIETGTEDVTPLAPILLSGATRALVSVQPRARPVDRARAWLAQAEPAVAGAGGHNTTFARVERVVRGFGLSEAEALDALRDWNARCQPPWSEAELRHKIRDGRERGDTPEGELRDATRGRAANDAPAPPGDGLLYHDGRIAKIAANVATLLKDHKIRWDRYTQRVLMPDGCQLTDEYEVDLQAWLWQEPRRLAVGIEDVHRGVMRAAHSKSFDALTEYVLSLPAWDNQPRLDRWLTEGLGAADTPVSRLVGRAWLISCMARALRPGCVADGVLVLQGKQGIGKNYAIETLFGRDHVGSLGSYQVGVHKEVDILAASQWVVHYPEFNAAKQNSDKLKDWVTSTTCLYRAPYAKNPVTLLRRAVLVTSTNDGAFLVDGENRRFWPVLANCVDVPWIAANREQLLAEALAAHRGGESHLVKNDNPLIDDLQATRTAHQVVDGMQDAVENALETLGNPERVVSHTVWECTGVPPERRCNVVGQRFAEAMRGSGYELRFIRIDGKNTRTWVRS